MVYNLELLSLQFIADSEGPWDEEATFTNA